MLTTWTLAVALLCAPTVPAPPFLRAGMEGSALVPTLTSGVEPAPYSAGGWWAPVIPTRVLAHFDPPEKPWLRGHRGIDLRATAGDPVRAARAGLVTFAGVLAGRGVVVVTHGDLRTTYEPVAPTVVRGDRVDGRDEIGVVTTGTGHCGSGDCLHLGLRRGREYLDPMLLLGAASPRLLPW